MIYRLTMDVRDLLAARKFPFAVEYGPERTTRVAPFNAIVIDRDRDANEAIGAAPALQRNPKKVLRRDIPCRALVYAFSSVDGARVCDHEHECDRYVDGLVSALDEWATAAKGEVTFTGARFATPADGVDSEAWPGVVYAVTFTVGRGVYARDYTGAGQAEGSVAGAGMRGTVRVQRQGSDADPEIIELG